VVLLRYIQDVAETSRAMSVIKTRASRHVPLTYTFEIGPDGITLGDPVSLGAEPAGDGEPPAI
jgi:circadian clock protein KaiC